MAAKPTSHPSPEVLRAFGLGQGLDEATAEAVSRHLDTCTECVQTIGAMPGDKFLGRLRDANAGAPAQDIPPELANHEQYEVLRELGRGGMGVVYLARHRLTRRQEVLKTINPGLLDEPGTADRFLREIRSAAQLDHPNIVKAHNAFQIGKLIVFVMEHVEGETLAALVKSHGPLPVANACAYACQVARGLQHAFERGLVHRDIKPQNLILAKDGKKHVVKILDFGLAKASREKNPVTKVLTSTGYVLGTPDYMAPEQTRNAATADIRADLYSLGCTLYFMLTGRPPFRAANLYDLLRMHQESAPPQLDRADVPPELTALIVKLLAKHPAERCQQPIVAAKALEPFFMKGVKSLPPIAKKQAADEKPTVTFTEEQDTAPPALKPTIIERAPNIPKGLPATLIEQPKGGGAGTRKTPRTANASYSTRIALMVAFGVLLLAVPAGLWFTGVFLSRAADKGTVRLVAGDDAARDLLREVGITLFDKNNKKYEFKDGEQRIPPGDYSVELGSLSDKLLIEPASFTLNRGETFELKVHAVLQSAALAELEKMSQERVTAANAKKLQLEWAKALGRPVEEANTIGMRMMLVPAGVFSMGSTPDFVTKQTEDTINAPSLKDYLKLVQSEAPQHKVRITRPFALGKYEVTVEQFRKFVKAEGYRTEMEKSKKGGTGLENGRITRKPEFTWEHAGFGKVPDQHPVSNVTWIDAEAFCKWLSKKENKHYRLPTEAEWEFACRAGTTTAWNFGDNTAGAEKYMVYLPAGTKLSTYTGPHAVGGNILNNRKPNDFGLYDMHGNVEEMCSDIWSADYYAKSPEEDPSGPHADSGDADKQKQFNPYRGKMPFGKTDNGSSPFDQGRPAFGPKPGPGPMPSKSNEPRVARGGSFTEIPQAARSAFRNSPDPTLGYVQLGFRVVCEISLPE